MHRTLSQSECVGKTHEACEVVCCVLTTLKALTVSSTSARCCNTVTNRITETSTIKTRTVSLIAIRTRCCIAVDILVSHDFVASRKQHEIRAAPVFNELERSCVQVVSESNGFSNDSRPSASQRVHCKRVRCIMVAQTMLHQPALCCEHVYLILGEESKRGTNQRMQKVLLVHISGGATG